jgi:O-antigen/teichoic acid export membrane protein
MTIRNPARFKILYLLTSSALVFYAISGLSAMFNYAFYPALSRLVSVESYGEVQFLVSSFNQLAVGFVVLNILAIILSVKASSAEEKSQKIQSLNRVAGIVASALATAGVIILLIFMQPLQLTSPGSVLLLGVALLVNVPLTTLIGQLQGSDKFIAAGLVGLIAAVAKLCFSLLFVILGLGTIGAVLGLVAGMVMAIGIGIFFLGKNTTKTVKVSISKHLGGLRHVRRQAFVGLLALSMLTLLSTIDIIGSRFVLASADAGLYAVVATLAKIIIAVGSPLMWLALPFAIEGDVRKVIRYVIITAIASGILTLLFFVDPHAIITIFMGVDPGTLASLLPILALSMSMYSIAFIVFAALICVDKLKFVAYSFTAAAALLVAAFSLFAVGSSLTIEGIIFIQLAIGLLLVILGIYGLALSSYKIKDHTLSV